MSNRTPQQIADQLNSLRAQAVSIVEGTIASAANPGGSITFTYINPIDGQPYTATGTAWNQCVPSKVSALKQTDGTWIVVGQHESAIVREAVHTDRRARPQPETGGKIKILYSQIEGDQRVFYLWGDRAAPKRISSIPSYAYTPSNASDLLISNRGRGDKFIVAIAWAVTNGATTFQSFGVDTWTYGITEAVMSYGNHISLGHGYWVDFYNLIDAPTGSYFPPYAQPYQTMLNKGAVTTYSGSRVVTSYTTSDNTIDVDTTTDTRSVPVLPSVTRPNYALTVRGSNLARDGVFYLPLCIDKNAQFALCSKFEGTNYISQPAKTLLISANSEIIIGGDASLSYDQGNLIGQNFYRVNTNLPTDPQWQVDIYNLSANTTKRTIKERVQYKHSSNYTIHSASYHP